MDRLGQLELLVAIAKAGSLSGAARAMGLSNAAASRGLAALEARLGVRLVHRNTRSLYLTDDGTTLLSRAGGILADLDDAEASLSAKAFDPVGVLRVSASLSFALQHIAPYLPDYMRRYPRVRVDIEVANRYLDLIDTNIDVAIRTREQEADSNITIRRLAMTRRILVASPGYLERRGMPEHPQDLAHHDLLLYIYARNPNELAFRHLDRGEEVAVRVDSLVESNDGQILRASALAGLGIIVQPAYIVHDDIASGALVPVLDDWDLPRLTINIAFQSRKHLSAKVRSFVDFMTDQFRRNEFERKWTQRYGG